jgi:hypothetical protein
MVHTSSQEIFLLLRNVTVAYRVQSKHTYTYLSQINPINTCKPYCLKIHFNIILPYTLRCCEWSLPLRISNQNCVRISPLYAFCMPCSSRHSYSNHSKNIRWVEPIMQVFIKIPVTSSLLDSNLLLSTPLSKILNLWLRFPRETRFHTHIKDQVKIVYKTPCYNLYLQDKHLYVCNNRIWFNYICTQNEINGI